MNSKVVEIAILEGSLMQVLRGVTTIVMGVRLLKPFDSHPKLAIVTRTLAVAAKGLKYFCGVFIPLFASAAIAGYMLFAKRMEAFATVGASGVTLMNLFLLGLDTWDDMYNNCTRCKPLDRFSTVLFYWSFIVIMLHIMLNIVLAIVMDSYAEVIEAIHAAGEKNDGSAILFFETVAEVWQDMVWFVLGSRMRMACTGGSKYTGGSGSGTTVVPATTDDPNSAVDPRISSSQAPTGGSGSVMWMWGPSLTERLAGLLSNESHELGIATKISHVEQQAKQPSDGSYIDVPMLVRANIGLHDGKT